jgi:hypothetical protein
LPVLPLVFCGQPSQSWDDSTSRNTPDFMVKTPQWSHFPEFWDGYFSWDFFSHEWCHWIHWINPLISQDLPPHFFHTFPMGFPPGDGLVPWRPRSSRSRLLWHHLGVGWTCETLEDCQWLVDFWSEIRRNMGKTQVEYLSRYIYSESQVFTIDIYWY